MTPRILVLTGEPSGDRHGARVATALREQWKKEVRTTMGLQIHGFPNLFTTSAPYAPAAAFCESGANRIHLPPRSCRYQKLCPSCSDNAISRSPTTWRVYR